ncbi:hypothetical protein ASAC_1460 [Acidilobus saccharovorans 345-15]|uniref:Uncharacterized protein n=1 Tax=Acidilobus saccharovorans (strain DSM 16705 / JCM 18335 / VKM B-2471 / 345-15) TaxID=666510 RepID=D9PZ78_ACIS3|nr:hypothetical protein ASAC_1460 [Acidilobus saccharovorans 345-15]
MVEGSAREVSNVSAALTGLFLAIGVLGAFIIVEGRGPLYSAAGIAALVVAALDVPVPLSLITSVKGNCDLSGFFLSALAPSGKSSAPLGSRRLEPWSPSSSERSGLRGGVLP